MFTISIVTINFNNSSGLEKTIKSVEQQTFKNFEYIIIDGGSTDGSAKIINEHKQIITQWVSEKDNGIYDGMNKGIQKAKGKYLIFLNSGDYLTDYNVIGLCNTYVLHNNGTSIFYGDIYKVDENKTSRWNHPEVLNISFFKNDNLNHQSSVIQASLFNEFGLYPERYKLAGDHWLFLLCFINNKGFKHINYPLVNYNATGVSLVKRDEYDTEMKDIWNELVPSYVNQLVDQYKEVEYCKSYPFLKAIVPVHELIIYRKREGLLIVLFLIIILTLIYSYS